MKISYTEIIKKSFLVAKKSKWLWIYGIILMSSGSSFNFSRSLSSQDMESIAGNLPASFGSVERIFTNWLSQINPAQIGAFLGGIAIFAIFGFIIKIILTSWAEGAMIYGASEAESHEVNLVTTSPTGLKYLKTNIVFKLISIGMSIALTLGIIIPTAIIVTIATLTKSPVISIIVGVVAVVAFVLVVIYLAGTSIYGIRLIVLKNYTALNAWKDGFKLARRYPFKIVLSAIVSNFIGGVITFVGTLASLFVLGLPVYFLLSPIFEGKGFNFLAVIPSLVLVFVFIWFNLGLSGAVVTFKTVFWNDVFERIWKEK